jgi:hypothetical protein
MLIALTVSITLLAVQKSPKPIDVAYIARYYEQGSKRSYDRLYVCALDGSGRQLVKIAKNVWDVRWVDRVHLSWIEGKFEGPMTLYVSQAPFATKTRVDSAKNIEFDHSSLLEKGTRIRCNLDEKLKWLSGSKPYLVDRKPEAKSDVVLPENFRQANKKWFIDVKSGNQQASFLWTNPSISYTISFGGGGLDEYTPNPEYVFTLELIKGTESSIGWLVAHEGITAHEAVMLVFRLDWKKNQARLIPLNVVTGQIDPRREILVGCSERGLTTFKNMGMDLWTSKLTVANLKTCKWRYIVDGCVRVGPVTLRP